jgi:hypothetical protein
MKVKIIGILVCFLFFGASVIPNISGVERTSNNITDKNIIKNIEKRIIPLDEPPEEEWNITFGGTEYDDGYSVQQTTDGGYIITGRTQSFSTHAEDVWVIKTDVNGTMEWNQTFGDMGNDVGKCIQQTTDGGYIITGYNWNSILYEFGAWLIKLDSNGNEQWNRTFGETIFEMDDFGWSVQQTTDGGYIIGGHTNSYTSDGSYAYDMWLIKTNSDGYEEWNKTFGGTNYEHCFSVQQTIDGGYIIAGGTASFGYQHDAWLIKTDADGNEQWNSRIGGGTGQDMARSVQQTPDNGYIFTGDTWSYGAGDFDVWLVKTDSDGYEEWNRTFGGTDADEGYSIQQTADGGYIIAGQTLSYGTGGWDIYLIKVDSNGNEQWNKTIGGSHSEQGFSVQQTTDRGYIITGGTESYGAGGGKTDVWLIKIEGYNNPPDSPDIDGPISGKAGIEYEYTFVTTDPNDDDVYYFIDWGDGSYKDWFGPFESGEEATAVHTWVSLGDYEIKAKAKDIFKTESDWSDVLIVTIIENNPPGIPRINGPIIGKPRRVYSYTFVSIDPDGDDVFYEIDWGDGQVLNWYGPHKSNAIITRSHVWEKWGTFKICARAKDVYGFIGDWGEYIITMPRDKSISNSIFLRFLERYPLLNLLFQKLIL